MPFLPWLVSLLSKITGEAIKSGTEVVKTATEIPKNLVEAEKARLEIHELKRTREEREALIVPATFADVKEFDPKFKQLKEEANRNEGDLIAYALVVALVAFGAIAAMTQLGTGINSAFSEIQKTLTK